jgi:SAM-dependent methyltransferase
MSTTQTHYDQLLGPVYTWMAGGFESAVARNRHLFESLGLASWPKGLAVDLGCGSGFQSIPLAEAGYQVPGLDLCESLLAELHTHSAGHLQIRTVCDNLTNFPNHLAVAPALIVCMGDTLTHLPSLESVTQLFRDAARSLAPGGRLVLGFRDLATHELKGPQRFIPVRNESDRIFTCFLDYQPDHVEVNDLLYLRTGDTWKFTSSSYRKLRLNAAQVAKLVTDAGLTLEHASTEQGLVRLVVRSQV